MRVSSSLQANYNKIRNHNKGKSTFSMAVNEFADMTFTAQRARLRPDLSILGSLNEADLRML
jgi:hypothetical protein